MPRREEAIRQRNAARANARSARIQEELRTEARARMFAQVAQDAITMGTGTLLVDGATVSRVDPSTGMVEYRGATPRMLSTDSVPTESPIIVNHRTYEQLQQLYATPGQQEANELTQVENFLVQQQNAAAQMSAWQEAAGYIIQQVRTNQEVNAIPQAQIPSTNGWYASDAAFNQSWIPAPPIPQTQQSTEQEGVTTYSGNVYDGRVYENRVRARNPFTDYLYSDPTPKYAVKKIVRNLPDWW